MRTRHATHPPAVPMVEGDAEGGGGGDLANGPLYGRMNRGSNPRRRRAPSMAHTTRPSMPLTIFDAKHLQTLHLGGGGGTLQSGGQKSEVAHKWAGWLHSPCRLGLPNALEWGTKSEVAHKWAKWLHSPCRVGGPQCLRVAAKIRGGPQVGQVAAQPLPPGGSPTLQGGGQNQQWPTGGHIGCMHAFAVKLDIFYLCGKVM